MSYEPKEKNEDYHVERSLRAGHNSAWSIYDEDGNGCGFSFETRESAQNYLDDAIENGRNPQDIHI